VDVEQKNAPVTPKTNPPVADKSSEVAKKPEEKPAAVFGGWFSQAVIDNSKGATVFVPDSDEELDDKETKSKPISKKNNPQTDNTTKAKESGNKRAKMGQK